MAYPANLETAESVKRNVRVTEGIPATTDGRVKIGLRPHKLERLAERKNEPAKPSRRGLGTAQVAAPPLFFCSTRWHQGVIKHHILRNRFNLTSCRSPQRGAHWVETYICYLLVAYSYHERCSSYRSRSKLPVHVIQHSG